MGWLMLQKYYIPITASSSADHLHKMHLNDGPIEFYELTKEQMDKQRLVLELKLKDLVWRDKQKKEGQKLGIDVTILCFDGEMNLLK